MGEWENGEMDPAWSDHVRAKTLCWPQARSRWAQDALVARFFLNVGTLRMGGAHCQTRES